MKWNRLAVEQGDAVAQANLGFMYAKGQGVAQDYQEAVRWYRLAAEQGHPVAQNNLGFAYELGHGVPQDYVLAYMWTTLAAAQGTENAAKGLEILEEKLSPTQLAEAQRLAREWKPKGSVE